MSHEEFKLDVVGQIGDAIHRRLLGNAALAAYFEHGDGIEQCESEAVRLARSWQAPILLFGLAAQDETALTSQANLDTLWRFTFIKPAEPVDSTAHWLRERIIQEVKYALAFEHGQLRDELDRCITEGILRFQAIADPEPIGSGAHLITRIRVAFRSEILTTTREFNP